MTEAYTRKAAPYKAGVAEPRRNTLKDVSLGELDVPERLTEAGVIALFSPGQPRPGRVYQADHYAIERCTAQKLVC